MRGFKLPLGAVPSPKLQLYVNGAVPPLSVAWLKLKDDSALTVRAEPALTLGGLKIEIVPFAVPALPYSSLAVTVTVYVPAVANVWLGFAPVPVVPSPKFHE